MGLGDTIREWLLNLFAPLLQSTWARRLFRRLDKAAEALERRDADALQQVTDLLATVPTESATIVASLLAALTGRETPASVDARAQMIAGWQSNPAQMLIELAEGLGKDPSFQKIQQTVGQILVNLMITPLEDTLDRNVDDPKIFSAQFHGAMGALTITSHILNATAQIASLGQLRVVADLLRDLYYNFGLGFMGWQTISPLLDIGIKEAGARYYQRRYRPRRWSVRELMDLYALRKLSADELRVELTAQGYRDSDIDLAVELAQTRLTVGDVLRALDVGLYNEAAAVSHIAERGYQLEDAAFLVRLEQESKSLDQREAVAAVAKTAYKKGVIDETRLRQVLVGARYDEERIALEIAVGNLARAEKKRDLTVGQVESAYKENVISETEARHYLTKANVDADAMTILLASWNSEKSPEPLRVNARTVSEAYVSGVLSRNAALDKLKSVGWSAADAELIVQVAELQLRVEPKRLSVSLVEGAFKEDVINATATRQYLEQLGFPETERDIVLETWKREQIELPRRASVGTITGALKVGVISREDALVRLAGIGLNPADAEIAVKTAEAEIVVTPRKPAESRILAAYNNNLIGFDDALARLRELNYSDANAAFILRSATIAPKPKVKRLSESTIIELYLAQTITRAEAHARLVELGYDSADADAVLQVNERVGFKPLSEAVVIKLFRDGVFDDAETIRRLQLSGYTREDAILFLFSKVGETPSA